MFGRIGRRICPKISVGKPLSTSEYFISRSRHTLIRCGKLIVQPSTSHLFYQPIVWLSSKSKAEAVHDQDVQDSSQDKQEFSGEEAIDDGAADTDYTLELTDDEIQQLTGGDTELIKKIKYIQLEHEVHR
jgi:hypothetical protein